ncbi:MAG: hypothetical protein VCD33_06770 [Alphaproteobacteria bacterium]|jgi:hypothetical protein
MIKWVTGCARLLATEDDGANSVLAPPPNSARAARIKERIIIFGAIIGLVAVLALA